MKNGLSNSDLRHYTLNSCAAHCSGGTPVGVRDRSLGRLLLGSGGVKRSKVGSRYIRRAVAKQRKLEARQTKTNKGGFS